MNTLGTADNGYGMRAPLNLMRWGAVFAGVAVGMSVHLLMMLLGAAAGYSTLTTGAGADVAEIPFAAGAWNTVSMLVAAFLGAYVAGRSSGLGRASDGMLYGVVSWGATTMLFAILATTALGAMAGGLFAGLMPPSVPGSEQVFERELPGGESSSDRRELVPQRKSAAGLSAQAPASNESTSRDAFEASANLWLRDDPIAEFQRTFGASPERAYRISEHIQTYLSLPLQEQLERVATEAPDDATEVASFATWWLFGATLGSLLLAIAGGALGARTTSRRAPAGAAR